MYQVDDKDKVIDLTNVPQSSVGAPLPVVLSVEGKVLLAFVLEEKQEGWDGSSVKLVDYDSNGRMAIVEFIHPYAHMFGPPNDEAFSGHPLARRGLGPYGAFQIIDSSWIRYLEKMNSVHPFHKSGRYRELRHLVFSFHDSTFECIAMGYEINEVDGSIVSVLPVMMNRLMFR